MYQKGYQHGQAIQLLSVIMLHDLGVTVCVFSEGSALFHINNNNAQVQNINRFFIFMLYSFLFKRTYIYTYITDTCTYARIYSPTIS